MGRLRSKKALTNTQVRASHEKFIIIMIRNLRKLLSGVTLQVKFFTKQALFCSSAVANKMNTPKRKNEENNQEEKAPKKAKHEDEKDEAPPVLLPPAPSEHDWVANTWLDPELETKSPTDNVRMFFYHCFLFWLCVVVCSCV